MPLCHSWEESQSDHQLPSRTGSSSPVFLKKKRQPLPSASEEPGLHFTSFSLCDHQLESVKPEFQFHNPPSQRRKSMLANGARNEEVRINKQPAQHLNLNLQKLRGFCATETLHPHARLAVPAGLCTCTVLYLGWCAQSRLHRS